MEYALAEQEKALLALEFKQKHPWEKKQTWNHNIFPAEENSHLASSAQTRSLSLIRRTFAYDCFLFGFKITLDNSHESAVFLPAHPLNIQC